MILGQVFDMLLYRRIKIHFLQSAAHRGLQEEMVYDGRQEAHVLQRPSGEKSPTGSWPVNMLEILSHSRHVSFGSSVEFRDWCQWPFLACVSQDAYALGEVFIGSKENSYTVLSGLPPSTQGYHWNHGITIVTPDRKFLFACETEAEQRDWIAAFQRVINRPMRPQEYAGMTKKTPILGLSLLEFDRKFKPLILKFLPALWKSVCMDVHY